MDEEQSTKLDFITIVYWNWNLSKLYSTAITLRIVWRFVLRRVEKLENVDVEVEFDTDTNDNAKQNWMLTRWKRNEWSWLHISKSSSLSLIFRQWLNKVS